MNPAGSVLIAMYGATIGKLGILNIDATTNQACCACYKYWINQKYLFFFLLAWRPQFIQMGGGGAQPNISKEKIEETFIPCPPANEQLRIVRQIDFIFELLKKLEISKNDIEKAVVKTKSKILELAMQGKLVEQDPTDEPAAGMLKRINPKAKIITDNPHSWNIPQGWVIANLKELIYSPSSKQFQILQSQIKQDGLIPVISQSSNFIEGYSENVDKAFHPNNGIVIFGDHTKNVKFFSGSFIIGADGVKLIDWDFDKRFLFHLITYVSEKIPNKGYSRHFQYLLPYVIGLPPLEEQKRIVAKIEELYSVLDKIEASLQS